MSARRWMYYYFADVVHIDGIFCTIILDMYRSSIIHLMSVVLVLAASPTFGYPGF